MMRRLVYAILGLGSVVLETAGFPVRLLGGT